jgi:hypothetical protein
MIFIIITMEIQHREFDSNRKNSRIWCYPDTCRRYENNSEQVSVMSNDDANGREWVSCPLCVFLQLLSLESSHDNYDSRKKFVSDVAGVP